MTTAAIERLLNDLEGNALFLSFSGGETFVRPDFLDILHAASDRFCVEVFTNGTLISQEIVQEMRALNVRRVLLSLYSLDATVHESITKIVGSHAATLNAIRMLRQAEIPVTINCVLMKPNPKAYVELEGFAGEVGADLVVDPVVSAKTDRNKSVMEHSISYAVLRDYHEVFRAANPEMYSAPPFSDYENTRTCDAGFNTCSISPSGRLSPCIQLPLDCGNVQDEKFLDLWRTNPTMNSLRRLTVADLDKCPKCRVAQYCERCPGNALLERGSLTAPYRAACVTAKIKSELSEAERRNMG